MARRQTLGKLFVPFLITGMLATGESSTFAVGLRMQIRSVRRCRGHILLYHLSSSFFAIVIPAHLYPFFSRMVGARLNFPFGFLLLIPFF